MVSQTTHVSYFDVHVWTAALSNSASSAIRCRPVTDERAKTYPDEVRLRLETMYSNAMTAGEEKGTLARIFSCRPYPHKAQGIQFLRLVGCKYYCRIT